MPRYSLKLLPSFTTIFPGASFVPAKRFPDIIAEAPAASALAISPEARIPPSAITGIFFFEANSQALVDAINTFDKHYSEFDSREIHAHARRFDTEIFKKNMRDFISSRFKLFKENGKC